MVLVMGKWNEIHSGSGSESALDGPKCPCRIGSTKKRVDVTRGTLCKKKTDSHCKVRSAYARERLWKTGSAAKARPLAVISIVIPPVIKGRQ